MLLVEGSREEACSPQKKWDENVMGYDGNGMDLREWEVGNGTGKQGG